jgi:hypothetical protein
MQTPRHHCTNKPRSPQVQKFVTDTPQLDPGPSEYTTEKGFLEHIDPVSKVPSSDIKYGFITDFLIFWLHDQRKIDLYGKNTKSKDSLRLSFISGQLSYSEIPRCFDYLLGCTGTLSQMTPDQVGMYMSVYLSVSVCPRLDYQLRCTGTLSQMTTDQIGMSVYPSFCPSVSVHLSVSVCLRLDHLLGCTGTLSQMTPDQVAMYMSVCLSVFLSVSVCLCLDPLLGCTGTLSHMTIHTCMEV